MTTRGRAAMAYAEELGFSVFPLHTVSNDGSCSCGVRCSSPGKHPRTAHGVLEASRDPAAIAEWWALWPEANIGIATGAPSKVIAVDLDGPAGERAFTRLCGSPRTPRQRTGSGTHWIFAAPDFPVRNRARLAPELDVRGDGGYIVAAPSKHASGRLYTWASDAHPFRVAPVALPRALLELVRRSVSESPAGGAVRAAPCVDGTIAVGARDSTLTSWAGSMRRRGMSEAAIVAALLVENQTRCVVPLPDEDVHRIARSVARYAPTYSLKAVGASWGDAIQRARTASTAEARAE